MVDPTSALGASPAVAARRPIRPTQQPRAGIGLALSGGGYRALLFHTGVLIRLNEFGLLKQVTRISSVSGGSVAAGLLAHSWRQLEWRNDVATNFTAAYVTRAIAASKISFDRRATIFNFLTQGRSGARYAQRIYDGLFDGMTLQQLPEDGTCGGAAEGPRFVFCATNLSTGSLFRFTRAYMADYRIGLSYFPDLPLAAAVAASAAFPPALSPLRLDLTGHTFEDDPGADRDPDAIPPEPVPDVLKRRALLSDGGVYDNHGLEPLKGWPTIFVSDGGMPHSLYLRDFWTWYGQMRRVIDVTDNQVRALRRRGLIERMGNVRHLQRLNVAPTDPFYARTGLAGTYWGIGTNPDKYKQVGGLECSAERVRVLSAVKTRLKDFGDPVRDALINWGYAICDKSVRAWHTPKAPPATDWPRPGGLGS